MTVSNCLLGSCFAVLAFATSTAAQETAAVANDVEVYDPKVFLESMVSYRSLALTCEDVIPGSPMADSSEILNFFNALGMVEPLAIDQRMQRITKRLVRSQSASICTERLKDRALNYGKLAIEYTTKKPKAWPAAPRILSGPWCRTESCSELSF